MDEYAAFLASKRLAVQADGIDVEPDALGPYLFPFQRDLVRWALRKGRAAIFADTGLGKTRMQLEWARLIGERTLILAPLTVARQTVAEGRKIGIHVHYTRSGSDLINGINITNYEMLDHFDAAAFGAVVLDESSILKSLDGKTRQKLTRMFAGTRFRLCCTATPAPNDISEIANHAEFLGIMTRAEMLATFFVHDDQGWRLKGHAVEPFYRWLASWGMSVRKPSDLGYSDEGYVLPELRIQSEIVDVPPPPGQLFWDDLQGIQDRHRVRRLTLQARVQRAADLINGDGDQWIAWVGLNDEGRELHRLVPDSVLVEGHQSPDEKAAAIEAFQDGNVRVLITKPRIAGFGMNLQNTHKMVFVGLGDSYEQYYQCIRRCWRYGQRHPVDIYIVLSEPEREIYHNVLRKEAEHREMSEQLIRHVQQFERAEIGMASHDMDYKPTTPMALPSWLRKGA